MTRCAFVTILFLLISEYAIAATVYFSTTTSTPSAEAIAAGVPSRSYIINYFVTTDADILSVNDVLIETIGVPVFQVPPPFGSDLNAPPPEFIELNRALEADSWITTPGSTSLLGPGLDMTDGTSSFGDLTNDGPQTDFHFARFTLPDCFDFFFSGRLSVAGTNGPEYFPFRFSSYPECGLFDPIPSPGSIIDLSDAYLNHQGLAPGAVVFNGFDSLLNVSISNESVPGLFAADSDGYQVDLSVDLGVARTVRAGTVATGDLLIETSDGTFSYSLTATIPEPSSLALSSFALLPLFIGFRAKRGAL